MPSRSKQTALAYLRAKAAEYRTLAERIEHPTRVIELLGRAREFDMELAALEEASNPRQGPVAEAVVGTEMHDPARRGQ